jgi:hypothetical protein
MDVVIDAQIVGWYCQVDAGIGPPPCTGAPAKLFERLGDHDIAWLDDGRMIESEWRRASDPDWFDAWFGDQLVAGRVELVSAKTHARLIKALETKCGFPKTGRDKWYVRVAATRADDTGNKVLLVSEDLDFYEPTAKAGGGNRAKILAQCAGCVAKKLKAHDIQVATVAACS